MRPHVRSGLPLSVAGLNLHRLRPALAASSRRREPDVRSTLLASTLPSTSIRKVKRTIPVSFARRAAAGYAGFSQVLASTTAGVRYSSGGFTLVTALIVGADTGTCTVTSGGGMYGGGGVVSLGGGGGGGLSGGGALISSMIFVSSGWRTTSTILRARPCTRA